MYDRAVAVRDLSVVWCSYSPYYKMFLPETALQHTYASLDGCTCWLERSVVPLFSWSRWLQKWCHQQLFARVPGIAEQSVENRIISSKHPGDPTHIQNKCIMAAPGPPGINVQKHQVTVADHLQTNQPISQFSDSYFEVNGLSWNCHYLLCAQASLNFYLYFFKEFIHIADNADWRPYSKPTPTPDNPGQQYLITRPGCKDGLHQRNLLK